MNVTSGASPHSPLRKKQVGYSHKRREGEEGGSQSFFPGSGGEKGSFNKLVENSDKRDEVSKDRGGIKTRNEPKWVLRGTANRRKRGNHKSSEYKRKKVIKAGHQAEEEPMRHGRTSSRKATSIGGTRDHMRSGGEQWPERIKSDLLSP